MEENKRVLLGMSGGTDSSVAAMRLPVSYTHLTLPTKA